MRSNSISDLQTPPHALAPLIPYLDKACYGERDKYTIWEPAQGDGLLTKELRRLGFHVIGSDIKTGQDFLRWTPPYTEGIPIEDQDPLFECIITNPPYDQKNVFLERVYELCHPFAFLMPLTTLETPKRQSMFKEHGLELILLNHRVNFISSGQDYSSGSWFAVAWFTNGLNIGQQLSFGEIPKIKPYKPTVPIPKKTVKEVF